MYPSFSVLSSLCNFYQKMGEPPASSDCFGMREPGCSSELYTFDRVFSLSLKGTCAVRYKAWESKKYSFITLSVLLKHLYGRNVHTCIHYMCSWLVGNERDSHSKRSGSGNQTPIHRTRTDLAIWPLPSGRGTIWLMALIITALLLIPCWQRLCVFARVNPLPLIPRGKTSYLKQVGVSPASAPSPAVTYVELG